MFPISEIQIYTASFGIWRVYGSRLLIMTRPIGEAFVNFNLYAIYLFVYCKTDVNCQTACSPAWREVGYNRCDGTKMCEFVVSLAQLIS